MQVSLVQPEDLLGVINKSLLGILVTMCHLDGEVVRVFKVNKPRLEVRLPCEVAGGIACRCVVVSTQRTRGTIPFPRSRVAGAGRDIVLRNGVGITPLDCKRLDQHQPGQLG